MATEKMKPIKAKESLSGAAPAPTTEGLVIEFMRQAGGSKRFAKMLYQEFTAATPGSITRQRILEAIMRGMAKIDSDRNPLANLGHLSDADLDRLIEEKISAVQSARDAEAEKEAADGKDKV